VFVFSFTGRRSLENTLALSEALKTNTARTSAATARGHKPRCCKVQIVFVVVAVVFLIVVVFGVPNSLLL
jgi:t-SNARE complex subunit (syntaxin)